LQGDERFAEYAALSVGQAGLKLLAAMALGAVLGPLGVIVGISIATFVTYVAAVLMLRPKLSVHANLPWLRQAATYLGVALPSTLALAVLLSSDILLVKHYFPTGAAGAYAAVAAIGRAIFWGSSGIAIVLFPKVAYRGAKGRSGIQLVVASLVLVALGGFSGVALLSVTSRWLLRAFAGAAYVSGAAYLPWYALGMVLLGAAGVLIATHQSRGKPGFLVILLPAAALEPIFIVAFHASLIQVVQVVDISMGLVAIGLAAWYLASERSRPSNIAVVPVTTGMTNLPQLQVNR
jgi:O-antigen/teichoic acid export membrane protein